MRRAQSPQLMAPGTLPQPVPGSIRAKVPYDKADNTDAQSTGSAATQSVASGGAARSSPDKSSANVPTFEARGHFRSSSPPAIKPQPSAGGMSSSAGPQARMKQVYGALVGKALEPNITN